MGDENDQLGLGNAAPFNWPFLIIEIQLRLTVTE